MKYSYKDIPETMKDRFGDVSQCYGFSWKEFIMTVPSPLFLVTTYNQTANRTPVCNRGRPLPNVAVKPLALAMGI